MPDHFSYSLQGGLTNPLKEEKIMKIAKQTINQIKAISLEAKSTYLGSAFRKEILNTPKSIYLLEEKNGAGGTNTYEGGLLLAANHLIMRYQKQLNFDEFIILLKITSNNQDTYLRVFLEPVRGVTRKIEWYIFRASFGRIGDIPLNICGIKVAEVDEVGLLKRACRLLGEKI